MNVTQIEQKINHQQLRTGWSLLAEKNIEHFVWGRVEWYTSFLEMRHQYVKYRSGAKWYPLMQMSEEREIKRHPPCRRVFGGPCDMRMSCQMPLFSLETKWNSWRPAILGRIVSWKYCDLGLWCFFPCILASIVPVSFVKLLVDRKSSSFWKWLSWSLLRQIKLQSLCQVWTFGNHVRRCLSQ